MDYGPAVYNYFYDNSLSEVRATVCKRAVYLHTIRICVSHVTSNESFRIGVNGNIRQVKNFMDTMRNRSDSWTTMIDGDFQRTSPEPGDESYVYK